MITKLEINNFKCFDETTIELGNINLFSGVNSSGKSSAIQSILLIDNIIKNPHSQLNGDWIKLGSYNEIRNYITRKEEVKIKIITNEGIGEFNLNKDSEIGFPTISFDAFYNNLFFLSAHRVGPQDYYPKILDSKNIVGTNGELLLDLFYNNLTKNVEEKRRIDNLSYTLDYHVNFWLKKILNINLKIEDVKIANIISVNYNYNDTKFVRPFNIGAGTSYIIGIIILCLYVDNKSTIILENPEIHLHPKAQSDLTEFLCFIANSGVQIIIESHSDHIFNGLRKAIKKKIITSNDVKIHFFKMNNNISKNHHINISEMGKIMDYEEGLFDQFDNDLDELIDF